MTGFGRVPSWFFDTVTSQLPAGFPITFRVMSAGRSAGRSGHEVRRPERPSQSDPLPKITLRHLARAERICPLRLANEHRNHTGNRASNGRYRVGGQIREDARLAQTDLGRPRREHFRPTRDLAPEQRQLYAVAADWYVTLFGDRDMRTADVTTDEWETPVAELGVRLVGPAGLALENENVRELRFLNFGTTRPGELATSPSVRFGLLRSAAWIGDEPVEVTVADLVHGTLERASFDPTTVLPAAHEWLGERVEVVRALVADPEPRLGLDCGSCGFVAGCPAHR